MFSCYIIGYATVLFFMLLSFLRVLFQGFFRFTSFPSNPWFLRQNSFFLRKNPVLLWFSRAFPRAVKGRRWVGVPWVYWRRPWFHTFFYPGVQFKMSTRLPISDPSPAPVPAGDWGAYLRGLFVNRTSHWWLRFVSLPTPLLTKGVLPFSLEWLDSIAIVRPGLPYLAFRPLKEQTVTVLTVLVFLDIFPPGQEGCHWLVLVRIRVRFT